jgi:hypothetical protein
MRSGLLLLGFALAAPAMAIGCGGGVASEPPVDPAFDAGSRVVHEAGTSPTAIDASKPDAGKAVDGARCKRPRPAPPTVDDDAGAATPLDGGTDFFATHPLPQVMKQGGAVLKNPRLVPVFFADDPLADDLERFVGSVGCTDYWRAAVNEYGVGDALPGTSVRLSEPSPAHLSDAQIESWLIAELTRPAPRLEEPTNDSIYVLFYGEATMVEQGGGTSCQEYGGYHSSVTLPDGRTIAYAVVPRCGPGFGFGSTVLDTATAAASHEIIEASTDPAPFDDPAYAYVDDAHGPWMYVFGGETSDLCAQSTDAFYTPPGYEFMVQRSWSNRAARSGDPCVPARDDAKFFTAAPNLPSVLEIEPGLSGRGVVVPKGTSKTIDVDLYDEESAGGDIDVEVMDYSDALGSAGSSSYTLDRSSGNGGETLHLTISTPSTASSSAELFLVFVSKGQRSSIAQIGVVMH